MNAQKSFAELLDLMENERLFAMMDKSQLPLDLKIWWFDLQVGVPGNGYLF